MITPTNPEGLLPDVIPCRWCGRKPVIGLGKKGSCQLHGEPFQSVKISCTNRECPVTEIEDGDIYNGGDFKAKVEAIRKWNTIAKPETRAHPTPPEGVMSAEEFCDIYLSQHLPSYGCQEVRNLIIKLMEFRDAQLSQAKGEGWVLVPKNMTKEMIDAGMKFQGAEVYARSEIKNIYADIIATAPKYEKCQYCSEEDGHPGFTCDKNEKEWREFYPSAVAPQPEEKTNV